MDWWTPNADWGVKLARADAHIEALRALLGQYRATDPYSLIPEATADPDRSAIRLRIHRPPPIEASAIVGDALHNIRSALDAAARAMTIHENRRTLTDDEAGWTGFPVCVGRCRRRTVGMGAPWLTDAGHATAAFRTAESDGRLSASGTPGRPCHQVCHGRLGKPSVTTLFLQPGHADGSSFARTWSTNLLDEAVRYWLWAARSNIDWKGMRHRVTSGHAGKGIAHRDNPSGQPGHLPQPDDRTYTRAARPLGNGTSVGLVRWRTSP